MSTIQLKSAEPERSPKVHARSLTWPAERPGEVLLQRYQTPLTNLRSTRGVGGSPAALIGIASCGRGEGGAELSECLCASSLEQLTILPVGASKAAEANWDSKILSITFDALRDDFDLALFDLPPLDEHDDGLTIARPLDGALLVVAADRVTASKACNAISQVHGSGTGMLGAVLNGYR